MIRIENLRKEYDAKTVALDDIDLVFEDSTFVALLGPSGCGKTTTLNCIAGLLEPTSGKIFFGDKDVTQLQPKDRNIGMVFQSYALYPHLKVIDNIAFPLKQKGMKKAERYEKARKIAEMLQIEYLLDRKPTQLSGGQQQRVSMARALVKEPDVLLLDEPMSNLDARLKIEIRDEIRRVQLRRASPPSSSRTIRKRQWPSPTRLRFWIMAVFSSMIRRNICITIRQTCSLPSSWATRR